MRSGEYLERGFLRNFDTPLFLTAMVLCALGVAAIYSANVQSDSAFTQTFYVRQIYWILLSLGVMGTLLWVDYRFIERMAYPIYFVGMASLVLVSFQGKVAGGSQRWLSMGGFNLQPSEFMKIAVIILLARVFDDMRKEKNLTGWDLIKPAVLIAFPFFIVARQPDLGTAIIYLVIFAAVAFFNGINRRFLMKFGSALALVTPLFWFLLKPYQQKRIITMLNPEADPMGQGYHIIQSKIAIGSGGLWGRGIFQGTQSKLNFLPAKHTDFIFSVFAEEAGFIGAMALMLVFYILIIRLIEVVLQAKDKFGSLLVAGVTAMIAFNLFYNMGMTLGLFPIVGIPLPFISYGGSALLTNFIGLGLALNVSMSRYRIE